MNSTAQDLLALVGRVLLAWIFIVAGYGKIGGFDGTAAYIAARGLPLPQLLAAGTVALELLGGAALVLGYRARWAAAAFAVFTALTLVFFHNYWAYPADQQAVQRLFFLKNLAIVGGLLMVVAAGAGRFSLDGRRR